MGDCLLWTLFEKYRRSPNLRAMYFFKAKNDVPIILTRNVLG
jgi:hypothetical protein